MEIHSNPSTFGGTHFCVFPPFVFCILYFDKKLLKIILYRNSMKGGFLNLDLNAKRIGFIFTGSFCSFRKTIEELKKIIKLGAQVVPIMSEKSYTLDTKYGKASEFIEEIENITGTKILHTIQEVEPLGPKDMLDIMVVAPSTSNTIAKLANDITDGPATMAVKSHLRKERPVVLAISASNGLSGAGENIGKLLNRKHYYFVPFRQDNPFTKPRSPVFTKIGFYSFICPSLNILVIACCGDEKI